MTTQEGNAVQGWLAFGSRGNSGDGVLRTREAGYLPTPSDPVIPGALIRRLGLRAGDEVTGKIGGPPSPSEPGGADGNGRAGRGRRNRGRGRQGRGRSNGGGNGGGGRQGRVVTEVLTVNGRDPSAIERRPDFTKLRAVAPRERMRLDHESLPKPFRMINRAIDLFAPVGWGQRTLIVAPAKAGKTTILQSIASGVAANYPDTRLFILLVDERPEEVTDMETVGVGEVIASSFDSPPEQHTMLAEMTLERARREVECGGNVVLVLDSLTRLARAYNTTERGSGRTLSGGLDAEAMEAPKRFFGSARAVDPQTGGGSLTIIATALIDTGSRLDQVIFEEFKGTGNSEVVLNRGLAERRIYPAMDLAASGTRREELLLTPEELERAASLRKDLAHVPVMQSTPALLEEVARGLR